MQAKPGRRCIRACARISFLFFLPFLFASNTPHAEDSPYLGELLASARQQKLYEVRYWRILLHYKPTLSGVESQIDDKAFFLAPNGKTSPQAEMEADIRGFFDPPEEGKKPAVCRFAARYEWLKEKLGIDPARLPVAECRAFENFMDKVKPESVTLVFPMAHLNSPASMFGHTLLIIETASKSKLLAYSVSYSAVTKETFGPFFAVKGIFGLYPGYFSVLPYYNKLQEYSDIDHRDIWEYPLNLTKPEIRRMLLHVQELDSIASDYYFFNENCSYLLYYLLEAARPTVRLTDQFHGWLIPLDSIRKIEEQGLVTGAVYRPSRTTKIRYLASSVPEGAQDRAIVMAGGKAGEDPFADKETAADEKMKTCELAGEYLQYLYTKKQIPTETFQERFLRILQTRSTLGITNEDPLSRIPAPGRPDEGHTSNRFAAGIGVKKDVFFEEMRIRAAYHGLMDQDDGYVEGAQLIFGDLALRHYPSYRKLSLDSLDLIDIFSISPRDKFFHPISWKIRTGLFRVTAKDGQDHLVYDINPGGGVAFKNDIAGLMYAMLESDLNIGGALKHDYAAGAGGSAGFIRTVDDAWKVHAYVKGLYYGLGDRFGSMEAGLQQSFFLKRNRSISLDVSRRKTHGFWETEAKALLNLFF